MQFSVVLTVAESKRLIARGVAHADFVRRAMDQGTLAIGSGTTNGYVVEEITGERIDKMKFVTGRTLPSGYEGPKPAYTLPDLVIRRGERLAVKAVEALKDMGPGDVFVKGINALNYDRGQGAVLIGAATGGGVGATLGIITARRIRYLHPAGLEKSVPGDLEAAAAALKDPEGRGPTLWVVPGDLFTEIEALKVLAGVRAVPIASGGIGGAEGAVWLAVFGEKPALDKAQAVLDEVHGEPPFPGT